MGIKSLFEFFFYNLLQKLVNATGLTSFSIDFALANIIIV